LSTISVTVPASERWVIREITLFYPDLIGPASFQAIDDGSDATFFYDTNGSGIGATFHSFEDLRIVLIEGRSFTLLGSAGPDVGLYGYALTLP
jgi:hypothetical protein